MRRSLLLGLRLLAAGSACLALAAATPAPPAHPAAPVPAAVLAAGQRTDGTRMAADVAYLADDLLEGRGTGTRGYELAARYVAARMASIGLEPATTDGYLLPVPFRRADLSLRECTVSLVAGGHETPLDLARDMLVSPDLLRTKWTTEAPLVFAGFGVTAPELQYDDFAGLDATGKVAVVFRGAPKRFPNDPRAYYSNSVVKDQNLAAHGAIGVISIQLPEEAKRQPWERAVRQSKLPAFRWVDEGGAPANTQATIEFSASCSPEGVAKLFAGAPHSFEEAVANAESSVAASFPLAFAIKAHRVTAHAAATSPNVCGILPGSDPKLRDECIVVSAHLDHLGISEPANGDSINNGAYDNASGTAMMLEVARTFASLPVRPKRTMVFLSLCGEEKGLQGSDYFARHEPPRDLTVVGDVNLDMVLLLRPLTKVIAVGAEHSSFGPMLERAATLAGLQVIPDPNPEEVVFVRSDQFSFIKQGVPSVFPVSGNDGTPEGAEQVKQWRVDHYHQPADDLHQPFDWPSGAKFTSMAFWTAWMAADAPRAPSWNAGDFFGARFGPKK